jgi:hypothetical protein
VNHDDDDQAAVVRIGAVGKESPEADRRRWPMIGPASGRDPRCGRYRYFSRSSTVIPQSSRTARTVPLGTSRPA